MWTVVSLGGSTINTTEGVKVEFLKKFREKINSLVEEGHKFAIITGGGDICRVYQKALRDLGHSQEDEDWIGLESTRFNAHLVRLLLKTYKESSLIMNPETDVLPETSIIIGAGWHPGWSSDMAAVVLAERLQAPRILNISNVSHVYTADPSLNPHAEKITNITWEEFQTLVGDTWVPGQNLPFDPIAAKRCKKSNINVAVLSAKNLENVVAAMKGEEFIGTFIH